jgi:hypothetical protein
MRAGRAFGVAILGLVAYDALLRPWMLDWGATKEERRRPLPGDEVTNDIVPAGMARHTGVLGAEHALRHRPDEHQVGVTERPRRLRGVGEEFGTFLFRQLFPDEMLGAPSGRPHQPGCGLRPAGPGRGDGRKEAGEHLGLDVIGSLRTRPDEGDGSAPKSRKEHPGQRRDPSAAFGLGPAKKGVQDGVTNRVATGGMKESRPELGHGDGALGKTGHISGAEGDRMVAFAEHCEPFLQHVEGRRALVAWWHGGSFR